MVETDDLIAKLDTFNEWLLMREKGRTFPLSRPEIDIAIDGEKVHFGFIDDAGFHSWRLNGFTVDGDEIDIDVAGAFGKGRETMRLIPRTPAALLAVEIEIARLKTANEIAEMLANSVPGIRLTRVALNERGGRIAQIQYDGPVKMPLAAIADVTGLMHHQSLMTTAMAWLETLGNRKKAVNDILVICEKRHSRNAQKLHAMLNARWRAKVAIAEIDRRPDPPVLKLFAKRTISDLWREKQKRFVMPESLLQSRVSALVCSLAPDKTDVIRSKNGETVRFNGLPFVRVRKMMGVERAWFGVGRTRRPLGPDSWPDLERLVAELEKYRAADPPNKRHQHYRTASESWLESMLRRDIRLLDANLVLSPIYNQFRSSSDKIDLLALRRDGRLVVIELKTQPDREMVFQAADYWRKIELQRRRGDLAAANLFGDTQIADRPTLIYLAAPAWSFHRDFEFFAASLAPEIELWRFELHETWRENIKVVSRYNYHDAIASR